MSVSTRLRISTALRRIRGPQLVRTAGLYVGAGLLTIADFRTPTTARWEAYDSDVVGLDELEERLYGDVIRPSDRVLLIGCGAGRDVLELRRRGYAVTGLEPSPVLAGRARVELRSRGFAPAIIAQAIEDYAPLQTYDVVIFSPYTYSYVLGSAARIATLARLKSHLAPGGRVLLTYAAIVAQSPIWILLARVATVCSRSDWRPEPGDRLSSPSGHPEMVSFEHHFTPDEVARECRAADFRVERDEPISPLFRFAVAVC
jgi:SAM-dependent methyltransferase